MTQDEKKKVKELIKLELSKVNGEVHQYQDEYPEVCSKIFQLHKELGL